MGGWGGWEGKKGGIGPEDKQNRRRERVPVLGWELHLCVSESVYTLPLELCRFVYLLMRVQRLQMKCICACVPSVKQTTTLPCCVWLNSLSEIEGDKCEQLRWKSGWFLQPSTCVSLQLTCIIHQLTWPFSPGAQSHCRLLWDSHLSYFL